MRAPRFLSALLVVATTGVVATTLSGCSLLAPTADVRWASAAAMAKSSDATRVPSIVPSDARDIRLRYTKKDEAGTQLAWSSASAPDRPDCVPARLRGATSLAATWGPARVPADGLVCGDWQVFSRGDRYYAWDGRER